MFIHKKKIWNIINRVMLSMHLKIHVKLKIDKLFETEIISYLDLGNSFGFSFRFRVFSFLRATFLFSLLKF